MTAVATFLGSETDWASCKKFSADQIKTALNGYDEDNINVANLEKIRNCGILSASGRGICGNDYGGFKCVAALHHWVKRMWFY